MLNKGAVVLLVAHSEYRGVYIGVARRLIEQHDARVHLYTATPQESAYYERAYPGLFASITVASALYAVCREPVLDEDGVIAAARRNEAELGVTINALAVSDRHLGRGFAPGGFRHPRSRISEETSYAQMLNGFNAVIAFWRRELQEKRPNLLLNAGKVLCVLARNRGVPVRILAGARYKNYYYWAVNEFLENPAIKEAFHTAKPTPDLCLVEPYDAHLRYRAHFRKQASLWRTVWSVGYLVLRHVSWIIRGFEKAKGYYVGEDIAYLWRRHRQVKRLTRKNKDGLDRFKDIDYAFFPLATEPEAALQILSPEYLYQLSAISSIARDLPAGAPLAVKEHYAAVGRRPADFYRQIHEFKNVRMMNMAELGVDAARASRVIVTISGTGGFEGAVMGKPVVSFGRHNIYNFLSHVMVVTDETQIKDYLARAFSDDFDAAQAAADGMRFLQAVIDTSFDLADFAPIEPDNVADAPVAASYRALLESFDGESCPVAVSG